jgi:hypothetical protein
METGSPEAWSRNIVKVNKSFGIQDCRCSFYAWIYSSLIYQLRLHHRNTGMGCENMRNIKKIADERLE